MNTYDTVIFDLDGTLLNTLEDLTDSVNYAMKKNDLPVHSIDEVRSYVGNGLRKLMERAIPQGTNYCGFEEVFQDFCHYYGEHCALKTRPYEGVLELLDELKEKGINIAIVSNKGDFAVKDLNKYYFDGKIEVAIGEREGIRRKPYPDTVFEAVEEIHADLNHTIYVGDSEVDILTAKNAGIPCVSVTWGFRDREFLIENGAERFADAPMEIMNYLAIE